MKIGVTGHRRLGDPAKTNWVTREIVRVLDSVPLPLAGLSSLAIGADSLFARAIVDRGGSLQVILPFPDYEHKFAPGHDREEYERLLKRASVVEVLNQHGSEEEAYLAAGKRVVDLSNLMIAVWDGQPAAGLGGTGDVVRYALECRKRCIHINPVTEETHSQITQIGIHLRFGV